jgi:hypothetical protein
VPAWGGADGAAAGGPGAASGHRGEWPPRRAGGRAPEWGGRGVPAWGGADGAAAGDDAAAGDGAAAGREEKEESVRGEKGEIRTAGSLFPDFAECPRSGTRQRFFFKFKIFFAECQIADTR